MGSLKGPEDLPILNLRFKDDGAHGTRGGRLIFPHAHTIVSTASRKNELRQQLRDRRLALDEETQAIAAAQLAERVVRQPAFRRAHRMAAYFAHDGEIDPFPILERAWALGKHCYLPVLSRVRSDRLWFAPWTPASRFRLNRFGIPEPMVTARQLVRAQELDLLLLPLVAFDHEGRRLGMGGGFYDRSLAFLRQRRHWHKPAVLGLAHDFQRCERLPADDWDIPLAGIVTDRDWYAAGPV